ncbi:MAG: ABC transporter ATP-binding protein/permease [Clostridiales bacterium]|nr:ABC transporter ATP-binding protein/permease [Clostridiales bacterium]
MIEIKNLLKTYRTTGNGAGVCAVDRLSVCLPDSGFVFVIGRSGCGKTTLLNLIGGIDQADSGEILYRNKSLKERTVGELNDYRKNDVSFVFQDYSLLYDYNVIENIKMPLRMKNLDGIEIEKIASEALDKVGLGDTKKRKINELSGGQQQRIAIARAIAKDSPILLCDEPTGNLDSQTAKEILTILQEIAKTKLVVMVTHDEEDAHLYGERLIRLLDGKIIEDRVLREIDRPDPQKNAERKATRKSLKPKDVFKLIFGNLSKSKILAGVILIVLVVAYVLYVNFVALSNFNAQTALDASYRQSGSYVFPVTKYVSGTVVNEIGTPYVGSYVRPEIVTEDDVSILSDKIGNALPVLKSYYFIKNIQDFSDKKLNYNSLIYDSFNFTEAILVEDFSKFYQPIAYGSVPKSTNEVLIYDYMAYNMIKLGAFDDVSEIKNFVGYTLTDKQTGLSMRVSGVLKSGYEKYTYVDDAISANAYPFEKGYLASLQTVFCLPNFKELIDAENDYISALNITVCKVELDSNGYEIVSIVKETTSYQKIRAVSSAEDFHIIASNSDTLGFGVLLSDSQFRYIYGEDADMDEVLSSRPSIEPSVFTNFSNYLSKGRVSWAGSYGIIGVYDDYEIDGQLDDEHTVILVGNPYGIANGKFRQLYLMLGNDAKVNGEVLTKLIMENKGEEFYLANPDYLKYDFTDYTPYAYIVYKAETYLLGVKDMGVKYKNYLVAASVLGICIFTFVSIKKHRYKIGVLKSLGVRNADIALIFGAETFLIAIAAFFVSIGFALLLMGDINQAFTKNYSFDIVFFGLTFKDFLQTFLLSIGLVLLSLAAPLIKIFFSQPIDIIRRNTR